MLICSTSITIQKRTMHFLYKGEARIGSQNHKKNTKNKLNFKRSRKRNKCYYIYLQIFYFFLFNFLVHFISFLKLKFLLLACFSLKMSIAFKFPLLCIKQEYELIVKNKIFINNNWQIIINSSKKNQKATEIRIWIWKWE